MAPGFSLAPFIYIHTVMALTPGGVDQDIEHLPYKRIQRPIFPFDRSMKDPDLSAKLIPVSGHSTPK